MIKTGSAYKLAAPFIGPYVIEEIKGNTALIRRVDQLAGLAFRSNVDKLTRVAGQYPNNLVWDGANKIRIQGRQEPSTEPASISILKQQKTKEKSLAAKEAVVPMEEYLPDADC